MSIKTKKKIQEFLNKLDGINLFDTSNEFHYLLIPALILLGIINRPTLIILLIGRILYLSSDIKYAGVSKTESKYINNNGKKSIYIEYYGNIEISSNYFEGGGVEDISNKIYELYYDQSNQYMIIKLNNKYYHYCNVQKEFRETFYNKKDKYKFYEKEIFGNFDARKGYIPKY